MLPVKLSHGIVGMPDRGFLLPNRRIWLVEFKSTKGRLSARQKIVIADLRLYDHEVPIVRSVDQFKALLLAELS